MSEEHVRGAQLLTDAVNGAVARRSRRSFRSGAVINDVDALNDDRVEAELARLRRGTFRLLGRTGLELVVNAHGAHPHPCPRTLECRRSREGQRVGATRKRDKN